MNMCPHCGEIVPVKDGLTTNHDYPKPCRQVCPGSKQIPRCAESDCRPLWNGESNQHLVNRYYSENFCSIFWGTHGCDKPVNHEITDVIHQCGPDDDPCTQFIVLLPENDNTEVTGAVRYSQGEWLGEHEGWSAWAPSRWFT